MIKYKCVGCGNDVPCICYEPSDAKIPINCVHNLSSSRVNWEKCNDSQQEEPKDEIPVKFLPQIEEDIVENFKVILCGCVEEFRKSLVASRKSSPPSCTCQIKATDVPSMGLIYYKRDCPVHGKLWKI